MEKDRDLLFDETEEKVEKMGPSNVFFEECGHWGPEKFKVTFWDLVFSNLSKAFLKKMPFSRKKTSPSPCPDCFLAWCQKHGIRCCICGGAILPGDGVALYKLGEVPEDEKIIRVEEFSIGCLRMGCCASGALFSGNWTEEGFAPVNAKSE
jgi:hypothetical protein